MSKHYTDAEAAAFFDWLGREARSLDGKITGLISSVTVSIGGVVKLEIINSERLCTFPAEGVELVEK